MADSLAELFVTLSAINAPMLAAFTEAAAAGEAMTASILAGTTGVDAAMARMAEATTTTATEMAAVETRMGAAATEAAGAATAATERMGGAYTATAARMSSDGGIIATAYGDTAAAAQASADKMAASAATVADANAAMRDKIVADLEAVKLAEAEAATANETLAAKMGGTDAAMGGLSTRMATGKAAFADVAGAAGLTAGQLGLAGLAAGAVTVATVKMAGDFQASTTKLVTSANETKDNIGMVRDGILAMAGQVGYSAMQLSDAMYKIESGGQHGADGLKVLQAAAEGAKTENANLTTVGDAVTTMLIDYHGKADDAALVTSKMVQATASGKMSFEELAKSLSSVAPIASAAHISMDDMLGTLASMTSHGISAEQATQNMADAIRHLQNPTSIMRNEMNLLGINADDVASKLGERGLSGTMQYLQQAIGKAMPPGTDKVFLDMKSAVATASPAVQDLASKVMDGSMSMKDFTKAAGGLDVISAKQAKSFATLAGTTHQLGTETKTGEQVMQTYGGALAKAMGDSTGLKVALMTTGENAGYTNDAIGKISGTATEAGGHVKGWAEIQDNFNQKLNEAKDGLGALAISIGEKLLPVVTPIVGAIADFTTWISQNQFAATALAIVIGGVVVGAFMALAVAVIAATWEFILAGVVIAAVVAGIVWLVNLIVDNWSSIVGFFQGIWDSVTGFFRDAWNNITGGITAANAAIGTAVGNIVQWFIDLPGKILGALASFGTMLMKPFVDGWNAVVAFFSQSPQQIGQELGKAAAGLVRAGAELIMSIHRGIVSGATAVYTFFSTTLPNAITSFVATSATWLINTGIHLLNGLNSGIIDGWHAVSAWFTALPGMLLSMLTGATVWLLTTGKSLLDGFLNGITNEWNVLVAWFVALPGNILNFFTSAPSLLLQVGVDILTGLWNGITSVFSTIWNGITGFITGFIDGFKSGLGIASPSTIFLSIGQDVIQGLWNGVVNMWGGFIGFVQTIPNTITGLFSAAGSWLVGAGYNVLMGLYNGIMSAGSWIYNAVTGWAASLINGVKSTLGIASPSVHMHEAGKFLVLGLATGIDDHAQAAADAAQRMAQKVMAASNVQGARYSGVAAGAVGGDGASMAGMTTDSAGATGTVGGSPATTQTGVGGGSGGGAPVTINVNVAGSVVSEQELIRSVQAGLLQHNVRNTGNAATYSGFR